MKIVILSCKTGGGHDAAAYAMKERLELEGHEAIVLDYLTLAGEKVSETVANVYIDTVKHTPYLFGMVYQLGMFVSKRTKHSPVYYANAKMGKYLKKYFEKHPVDAILMTHLYPAETLTFMKRKGVQLPPTVAIMTDYTCIPFWEETDCDFYVTPHISLVEECVKRGIPMEKLVPIGIPVKNAFYKKIEKERVRQQLGFPKEKQISLVIGGSMGAGNLEKLTQTLVKQKSQEEMIVVICGSNQKIFEKLSKKHQGKSDVVILGKINRMPYYMRASDIVYTKPGGITSTEVAVLEKPLVHTADIPGCETANKKFFKNYGLSIAPKTVKQQVKEGKKLLNSKEKLKQMQESQRKVIEKDSAGKIVKFLETIISNG